MALGGGGNFAPPSAPTLGPAGGGPSAPFPGLGGGGAGGGSPLGALLNGPGFGGGGGGGFDLGQILQAFLGGRTPQGPGLGGGVQQNPFQQQIPNRTIASPQANPLVGLLAQLFAGGQTGTGGPFSGDRPGPGAGGPGRGGSSGAAAGGAAGAAAAGAAGANDGPNGGPF